MRWDCTFEPRQDGKPIAAVRLGFWMVTGLGNHHAAQVVAHRGNEPYTSIEEISRRAGTPAAALERLAEADAFRCMNLNQRQALWQVRALAGTVLPLFAAADARGRLEPEIVEPPTPLAPMRDGGEVVEDHRSTGLSLRSHPVAFLRTELR